LEKISLLEKKNTDEWSNNQKYRKIIEKMQNNPSPIVSIPVQVHPQVSEEQLLDLLLDGDDLGLDLRTLILSHAGSNDWPADPTSSAQGLFGPDEHVGHVLILAQEGDVEQNLQRLTVSSQDHKLCLSSVEGLSSLIGSLPQLLVV